MAYQGTPHAGTLAIGRGNNPGIRHTCFHCPHEKTSEFENIQNLPPSQTDFPLKGRTRTQRRQGRGQAGDPLIYTPFGRDLCQTGLAGL